MLITNYIYTHPMFLGKGLRSVSWQFYVSTEVVQSIFITRHATRMIKKWGKSLRGCLLLIISIMVRYVKYFSIKEDNLRVHREYLKEFTSVYLRPRFLLLENVLNWPTLFHPINISGDHTNTLLDKIDGKTLNHVYVRVTKIKYHLLSLDILRPSQQYRL